MKKKDKIYHYIIQKYAPSKIAKLLKCSKPYVSKIIKQLINEGYIVEVFKKDGSCTKPKIYDKTSKSYPSKLTDYSSGINIRPIEQPRLNLIALKFSILDPPKKNIPGKHYTAGNTNFITYSKLFVEGRVTFKVISDKILVVFMPETIVSPEQIRHTKHALYDLALSYSNWFEKTFICKLGDGSLYQDYHIAIHESDPYLVEMSKKYGMLKVIDSKGNVIAWWDFSKGPSEFETRDEKIAENKVFGPVISMNLQDRVYHLESEIAALNLAIEAFEATLHDMARKINRINDMFRPPDDKPFNGVGYE